MGAIRTFVDGGYRNTGGVDIRPRGVASKQPAGRYARLDRAELAWIGGWNPPTGAEDADIFISMTEGDNRNVMAAQVALEALGAKRVIAKINDPVRAEAYADLGIATLCRTTMMADAVAAYLDMPVSGRTGILPPTGSHPGGEDHHEPIQDEAPATGSAIGSAQEA